MKYEVNLFISIIGTIFTFLFGGWSMLLNVLVFVMAVDYLTGVLVGLSGRSKKTKKGGLSSKVGFKGLLKKVLILLIVTVAYRIDFVVNANQLLYYAVIIFYISNESISILENAALLDVPIPDKLINAIEALKEDEDEG